VHARCVWPRRGIADALVASSIPRIDGTPQQLHDLVSRLQAALGCGSRIANSRADSEIGQRCLAPGV
jgi:hypothetical protein